MRPIYAGNGLWTVKSLDKLKLVTVRPTNFDKAAVGTSAAPIERVAVDGTDAKKTKWEGEQLTQSLRPELTSSRYVDWVRGLITSCADLKHLIEW